MMNDNDSRAHCVYIKQIFVLVLTRAGKKTCKQKLSKIHMNNNSWENNEEFGD